MHKLLLNHRKFIYLMLFIAFSSLLLGYLYFNVLDNDTKVNIINSINNNNIKTNYILKDLIILSTALITSFFVIGIPLSFLYYFYNVFSIGFFINAYLVCFKTKGLLFISIYLLLNRIIPIILIIFFTYKLSKIGKLSIKYIFSKNYSFKDKIANNFKKSLFIIIIILIVDVILALLNPLIKL